MNPLYPQYDTDTISGLLSLRKPQKEALFILDKVLGAVPLKKPTVEYSLTERGKSLLPALSSLYKWAEEDMNRDNG